MKTDEQLQTDVQDAIMWEPQLKAAEIGVTVRQGVVTLTGAVDNYAKKMEAEEAAKNVAGVQAVVESIEVKPTLSWSKNDYEIAMEAVKKLNHLWALPNDSVQIIVSDGWITLEGGLHFEYQRIAVIDAVAHLPGVRGVHDNTSIKVDSVQQIDADEIKRALQRHWSLNAKDIMVVVSGMKVTLLGTVTSVYQKDEAGMIARKHPGVVTVENDLVVDYDYALAAGVSRPL